MSDSTNVFDPLAGFGEMQAMYANWASTWQKMLMGPLPIKYEAFDPVVQEIAVLATMHNMASMLQAPGPLKAQINAELVERAKQLQNR